MNLIKIGKKLDEKCPKLFCFLVWSFNHSPFNNSFKISKGNNILINSSLLKKTRIIIKGKGNKIIIGKNCLLKNTTLQIYGNNNKIILGEKVFCKDGDFYIEDSNGQIIIDEHTTFSGKTHLAVIEGSKISIGKNCLLSSNVVFRVGDSHSILDLNGKRINPSKAISIGNHVWIGNDVKINKGVSINDNSIIGTGAIVTKSVTKTNVIIAGNPATIIKENTNWCTERVPVSE